MSRWRAQRSDSLPIDRENPHPVCRSNGVKEDEKRSVLPPIRLTAAARLGVQSLSCALPGGRDDAANGRHKPLFYHANYRGSGGCAKARSPSGAAAIACFLRNTFPKTALGACD
jgi:hypothetical protein